MGRSAARGKHPGSGRWKPRRQPDLSRPLPALLKAAVVAGAFVSLSVLERRRPLRPRTEGGVRHLARDLSIGAVGALVAGTLEVPLAMASARKVHAGRLGLLASRSLPPTVELVLGVAAMDYTMFAWHGLTHKVPVLWRFHAVHHLDRDLDAATALRFHFGELLLSVPFRVLQVRLLGIAPRTFDTWQTVLLVGILFHHSNLRLPRTLERWLVRLVVTPRMHGVHHSTAAAERNTNWSSGILSVWDHLHRTFRLEIGRPQPPIGLEVDQPDERTRLWSLLALPFRDAGSVGRVS